MHCEEELRSSDDRLAGVERGSSFFRTVRHRAFGALLALAATSFFVATPASAAQKVLSFSVVNGAVVGIPDNTVAVQQGDDVELKWTSDKPMELHLHGYDIAVKVAPDAPAHMSFNASIPGRFSIEQHGQGKGHHAAVLYLEVRP
jgi:FtsP/CotA-like multicopper oxidase with cupredoxin domain